MSNPNFTRPQAIELARRLEQPRRFIQVVSGARQVGKTTMVGQVVAQLGIPSRQVSADEPTLRGVEWIAQQWEAITNPVTGDVEEGKLVKPTGITSFESDMGTSLVCRYTGGIQHNHPDKYAEFAPFEYSGS